MWPTLVLTAGLGTRARPLSRVRAKAAFPVAGMPLAGRILRSLEAAGIGDAVLNLHHKPSTITASIGDGSDYRVRVRYSWEPDLLGSAGGPRRALSILGTPRFLIVNGDTLSEVDISAVCRQHVQTGARVTMALVPHPEAGRYGGVLVDGEGRVTGFTSREAGDPSWHFVGIQAVDANVFSPLPPDRPCESVSSLYRDLIVNEPGSVRAFRCQARFRDVGTPADYLQTSLDLARDENQASSLTGQACRIASSARVTRTILWDRVVVGADVELDQCVVADDVVIPAGSRFAHAAIVRLDDAEPGAGDMVEGQLLVSPLDPAAGEGSNGEGGAGRGGSRAAQDRGKDQQT